MPALPQKINFIGEIHHPLDISAIASLKIDDQHYLAIGSDESQRNMQLMKQVSDKTYEVDEALTITLPAGEKSEEIDIESISYDKSHHCLHVAGSYSKKRKRVKLDGKKTSTDNRRRLTEIKSEKNRNQIFHINLDPKTGKVIGEINSTKDLKKKILEKDNYLKAFIDLPSKENGIDIEGLAFKDEKLWLGCRGPILRGNYVPVIIINPDDLKEYEIRFVILNGNGIRDIVAVENGFLLIAGPMGDAPGPYQIYFWDGSDMVYGTDRQPPMPPAAIPLDIIPTLIGKDGVQGKPEGITVLQETAAMYKVLIVYDSLENGKPEVWSISKL